MRTGALGDFCITLPVLEALFATGERVDVMCQPRFEVLVREVGTPGRVWDAGGVESLWLFGGGGEHRGGDVPHRYSVGVGFSAAHAAALRACGIPDVRAVEARPALGVSAVDHFRSVWPRVARRGPRAPAAGPVVIAPGASAERRCWPMERWRAVADGLATAGREVRWIGGPLEPWATDRPDLAGLRALARACGAWLGADSGPAHLAAWAGAPVGIVARPESNAWAPEGARVFGWEAEPAGVVEWAIAAGTPSP